ncbi:MAG: hypothetical protein ACYC4J_10050 [Gemmatimonadaceae bacterium]
MSRDPLRLEMPLRGGTRRSRNALIVSVIVHLVVVVALLNIVFRYDLAGLVGLQRQPKITPERIIYTPVGPAGGGGGSSTAGETPPVRSERAAPPSRLTAPTTIPTTIPAAPSRPADGGSGGGTGGGRGDGVGAGTGSGTAALGVRPGYVDGLWGEGPFVPAPKTRAQRVDSTVKAAFGVYEDSVRFAQEHPQRAPGDWTKTDAEGRKWGWDPKGVRLGKLMIPNALLALLPINAQGNPTELERGRRAAYARTDIMYQANKAQGGDEFKRAVARIRARKEKERAELMKLRAQSTGGDATPRDQTPAPASP